jgi:hypothetical protein|tara:strand:- start:475 stop:780 length:306 start_codon:yes stop_codon:yes gene_type:complete
MRSSLHTASHRRFNQFTINFAPGLFHYRFGVGKLCKLQDISWAKHSERFGKDPLLVQAQIDNALGDGNVGLLAIVVTHRVRSRCRIINHVDSPIDPDDVAI